MNAHPTAMSRSPSDFAHAIAKLPADDAASKATKEMWRNWLSEYSMPGYYNRKGTGYDARFAYNHVQNPGALLWLAEAAGGEAHAILAAQEAVSEKSSLSAQAAAVRKHLPWSTIESLLWGSVAPNNAA